MPEQIPFIGREDEIIKISKLIEKGGDCQIICIHGVGGIGKTRLLKEIQERYSSELQKIEKRVIKIALVQEFDSSEWGQMFLAGVRSMADEFGVKLIEPDTIEESDIVTNFENVMLKTPEAIILREGASAKLRVSVQRALDKGIKVLTFDNRLQINGLTTRITHDGYKGVVALVEQLIQDIGNQGGIGIIKGENDHIQKRRTDILYQVLHDYVDIIPHEKRLKIQHESLKSIRQQAYNITKKMVIRQPKIKAIWTTWNEIAKGIVKALIDEDKTNISVYSFDLNPSDIELFCQKNSPWKATVTTDPREGGRIVVRLAIRAVYECLLKPEYRLSPRLITQTKLQEQFYSEEFLWGESEIGWTSWLKSLQSGVLQLHVAKRILDFDDQNLHTPENTTRRMAAMLDQKIFTPFFQVQVEYFKKRDRGESSDALKLLKASMDSCFAECFNIISNTKRVLFFFDTSERLEKEGAIWQEFTRKIPLLRNGVFFIAGRNAAEVGKFLENVKNNQVEFIKLGALSDQESLEYLQKKQKQMYITIEPDLIPKLLILSEGRPIILDLAVEWRARGILLDWLINDEKWRNFQALNEIQKKERLKELEKHLVSHIKKLESPRDEIILLMAYIHPLNVEMLSTLLNVSNASGLFKEIEHYAFVKQLPNGYLKLQDVMEAMVEKYVWPEIDPENERRRWYSTQVIPYFREDIQKFSQRIEGDKKELRQRSNSDGYTKETLELSIVIEELEQHLWLIKEQYLTHTLATDLEKGVEIFARLFDEATKTSHFSLRKRFFEITLGYMESFKLTKQSFNELKDENIPGDTLDKLKSLENKECIGKHDFLNDIDKCIGEEQTGRYKEFVLKHTRYIREFSPIHKGVLELHQVKLWFDDEKKYQEAKQRSLELLEKRILSIRYTVEAWLLLGNSNIRLGNVEESISDFKKAVEISKSNKLLIWHVKALNGLGWALSSNGGF